MAGKKGPSGLAVLINGAGFLVAVLMVMHILFVLMDLPNTALADSVGQAAVPLALFFPGLVDAQDPVLQVLVDFGLAAAFWVMVGALLAKVFG